MILYGVSVLRPFPSYVFGENIGYGLKMLGRPKAEIKQRFLKPLELVDLVGFEDRLLTKYLVISNVLP